MAYCEDNVAVLEKMGLTPKDIDAIIITHLDYDHFEGISAFKDSTAPVYCTRPLSTGSLPPENTPPSGLCPFRPSRE